MMSHEEISERLGPYVRGELDAPVADAVAEHLATCDSCSAELRALRALGEGGQPLSDVERARLQRGVEAAIGREARRSDRWRGRIAPALGAAALLALVAVGAANLVGGSGDEDFGGGDESLVERGAESLELVPSRRSKDDVVDAAGGTDDADEGGGEPPAGPTKEQAKLPDSAAGTAAEMPTFDPSTRSIEQSDLHRLARRAAILRNADKRVLARYETLGEGTLVEELAETAPMALRDQLVACADRVRARRRGDVLAAYATLAEVDRQPSLVLGFLWQPPQRASRVMLWAWPRGSCEEPLAYSVDGNP